jgi:hypothetical protein
VVAASMEDRSMAFSDILRAPNRQVALGAKRVSMRGQGRPDRSKSAAEVGSCSRLPPGTSLGRSSVSCHKALSLCQSKFSATSAATREILRCRTSWPGRSSW